MSDNCPQLAVCLLVTLNYVSLSSGKLRSLRLPLLWFIPSWGCNSSLLESPQEVVSRVWWCFPVPCLHVPLYLLCWPVPLQGWQFLLLALASAALCQVWLWLHSRLGAELPFPSPEQKPSPPWPRRVFCLGCMWGVEIWHLMSKRWQFSLVLKLGQCFTSLEAKVLLSVL